MNTRFFALAALALSLAACNNDNENEILNDGPVAAKFTADIYGAVSTRVNSEGTDWTDGDRIGITGAGCSNVPYVRRADSSCPRVRPSISRTPKRRPSMPTTRIRLRAER